MKFSSSLGLIFTTVTGFILAIVAATVTGVSFHTYSVLGRLTALGVSIPFGDRLRVMEQDLIGLAPTYSVIIAIALAVSFLVAAILKPRAGFIAPFAYPMAGGAGVAVALLAMHYLYNGATPIAGARGALGFSLQSVAGALGGLVFSFILALRKR